MSACDISLCVKAHSKRRGRGISCALQETAIATCLERDWTHCRAGHVDRTVTERVRGA
jgi:hypothetical protein